MEKETIPRILRVTKGFILQESAFKAYRNSLVLQSLPKSGTNYVRLFLTNYTQNIERPTAEWREIDYFELHNELFPNVTEKILDNGVIYKTPKGIITTTSDRHIADFIYGHYSVVDNFPYPLNSIVRPYRKILLYRNPLDILISWFFYFHKKRGDSQYEHPRDLIDEVIPKNARFFATMQNNAENNDFSRLVSYEKLKSDEFGEFKKLIKFIGLPLDEELIEFAIVASSIKKVKEAEKKSGQPIHAKGFEFKGSFIRSGKSGQWKNYLNNKDLNKVERLLQAKGLSLSDFVLE